MRMAKYALIDTSAWILALRKGGPESHRAVIDRLIREGRAATTGLVLAELLAGVRTRREFRELAAGLSALIRFDPGERTWLRAAEFAFELRRDGITVPTTDVLILTVAWENGCALIHADRHFELIHQAEVGLENVPMENILLGS